MDRVDSARDSVSAVSIDEEMTNLVAYQHAYSAAAKYVSAIDSTLDTLINMVSLRAGTTMSMRVTPTSMNRSVMTGLQANLARLQRTQEQLSSGRRINRPSDSPTDTAPRCGCAGSRPAPSSSGATSTTGSPGSGRRTPP